MCVHEYICGSMHAEVRLGVGLRILWIPGIEFMSSWWQVPLPTELSPLISISSSKANIIAAIIERLDDICG